MSDGFTVFSEAIYRKDRWTCDVYGSDSLADVLNQIQSYITDDVNEGCTPSFDEYSEGYGYESMRDFSEIYTIRDDARDEFLHIKADVIFRQKDQPQRVIVSFDLNQLDEKDAKTLAEHYQLIDEQGKMLPLTTENSILKKETYEPENIKVNLFLRPETYRELSVLINDPKVNLGDIDTSRITDMASLFSYSKRTDFSGIEKWNVSNVTSMEAMFAGCHDFNQDLNDWNVSNVTDMFGMFDGCKNFNQDISAWDVSKVKDMSFMFARCEKFNQPLNGWNVREDCDTDGMFFNSSQTYENVKDCFSKKQLLCANIKSVDAKIEKEVDEEIKKRSSLGR